MTAAAERSGETIHGVAVAVRDAGVLLRGRSGAGKSAIAEELVALARGRGWFGSLVADDRVRIERRGGRLVLSPHRAIAGRIERRGQGIFEVDHESAIVLRLVVDLVDRRPGEDEPPRYPQERERAVEIAGVSTPRLALACGEPGGARAILQKIAQSSA